MFHKQLIIIGAYKENMKVWNNTQMTYLHVMANMIPLENWNRKAVQDESCHRSLGCRKECFMYSLDRIQPDSRGLAKTHLKTRQHPRSTTGCKRNSRSMPVTSETMIYTRVRTPRSVMMIIIGHHTILALVRSRTCLWLRPKMNEDSRSHGFCLFGTAFDHRDNGQMEGHEIDIDPDLFCSI